MDTPRFNRHEVMDSQTREEILDLIGELKRLDYRHGIETFSLQNWFYGFYDGYNYVEKIKSHFAMKETQRVKPEVYDRIMKICDVIESYPKVVYQS